MVRAVFWHGNWTELADLMVYQDFIRNTPLPRDNRNHEGPSGKKLRIFMEKLIWSHGAREIIGSIFLKLIFEAEVHELQVLERLSTDVISTLNFN